MLMYEREGELEVLLVLDGLVFCCLRRVNVIFFIFFKFKSYLEKSNVDDNVYRLLLVEGNI